MGCVEEFCLDKTETLDIPAMDALRAGDESAWTTFFAYFDAVIRSIVAWPKWHFDPHTREDVAQTIKIAIMQSLARLQSEQSLQAFVRKICINRCIDMLRRQLREQGRLTPLGHWNEDGEWEDVDVAAGPEFDPVAALQQAERAAVMRAALARMDEASQAFIRQFYVEGLSYREMAQRQGVTVNTVGSRLSRCLDKLRDLLERTDKG
jgi:RNA polymerase sigma-70 factor (ECF subfamily)